MRGPNEYPICLACGATVLDLKVHMRRCNPGYYQAKDLEKQFEKKKHLDDIAILNQNARGK